MILKELKLTNFISHKNTKITFGPGITVIIGHNGAGKSSILDAIYFALFKESSRGNLDDLIHRGERYMEVDLTFSIGNRTYHVFRRKKKGKGKTTESKLSDITEGVITLERTPDGATKKIEELIGLNKDLFKNAIYIQQGEIDALLEKGKTAARKKLIGRLLGLDSFEVAYEKMKDVIAYFDSQYNELKGEIKRIPDVKLELENIIKRRESIEREIKELTKELQQAKQEFEKYKVLKEKWDEKQSLFKVLVSKLELHEKRLTELDKEIQEKTKDLEKIKIAEKSLEKILPELKNLDILKRANNLKVDLDKIIIEHNNVLSRVEEILNLEKLLNEHKDNYKKYMDIDAKIKKLSEDKEKLSKSQGEYKSLQERLESVREEINSHKEQLENIFESIRKANLPIELTAEDTAVNVKKKIKELKETINNLQSNVEELEKKIGIATGSINEAKEIIKTLKEAEDKCPVCGSKLTPEHKEMVLKEQQEKINSLETLKEQLSKEKSNLEAQILKTKEELTHLQENVNPDLLITIAKQISEKEDNIKTIENRLLQLKKDIDRLSEIDKALSVLRKDLEDLKSSYESYITAEKTLQEKKKDKDKLQKKKNDLEIKINEKKTELQQILQKITLPEEKIAGELERLMQLKNEEIKLSTIISRKNQVLEELDNKRMKFNEHKQKVEEIKNQLKDLGFDEKKYQEIKNTFSELQDKVANLSTNLEKEKGLLIEIKEQITKLEKELKGLEEKSKEYKRLEKYIEFLKNIRKQFDKDHIQNMLRQRSKPIIEYYTQNIFQEFNMSFSDIRLTDDYNVVLLNDGAEFDIDMISGGERIAVALALRLGIAKALAGEKLELIMLDEPTVHLDPQRREDLVNILVQMRSIPQVIIVSHDEELKQAADTILSVKLKNGVSEVKVSDIDQVQE